MVAAAHDPVLLMFAEAFPPEGGGGGGGGGGGDPYAPGGGGGGAGGIEDTFADAFASAREGAAVGEGDDTASS